MKKSLKKIIFFDPISLILIIVLILVSAFTVVASIHTNGIAEKNNSLKIQLTEIRSLSERYIHIKNIVESKENKIGLTKTAGVVSTLEQTLDSLGLKANIIKPLEKKRINEFIEEDAELEIKKIDLNSIVNLLHRIDNSPVPMRIKQTFIKTAFEDPDKFTLKITVSLISKA